MEGAAIGPIGCTPDSWTQPSPTHPSREQSLASDSASLILRSCACIYRGGGDDFAGAIGREYSEGAGAKGLGRRDARDAGDYMKADSNF